MAAVAVAARRRGRAAERREGVIGYVRVSTEEQAMSGLGIEAQEEAIRSECQRRSLTLLRIERDDGYSARTTTHRPGLRAAVQAVAGGEASVLMVSKLDRLTRSVKDAYELLEASRSGGWALVALDLGVDTTTPSGEMMAGVASVFAQFERRVISQRTKDALAAKKARGVQLGRPRVVGDVVTNRIVELRNQGQTWRAIATALASEEQPTGHGGQWHANTVRRIYDRQRGTHD